MTWTEITLWRKCPHCNHQGGHTAKVFLQFDSTEKGSSGDYDTAARRSLAGLSHRVSQQVKDGISSYFENQ